VRSLDGSGPQERGVALEAQANRKVKQNNAPVIFSLKNTGKAAKTDQALHPSDATAHLNSDVYRLSLSMEGEGWAARLLNGLAAVDFGGLQDIPVYVSCAEGSAATATVTLRATSESDPAKSATATVQVSP